MSENILIFLLALFGVSVYFLYAEIIPRLRRSNLPNISNELFIQGVKSIREDIPEEFILYFIKEIKEETRIKNKISPSMKLVDIAAIGDFMYDDGCWIEYIEIIFKDSHGDTLLLENGTLAQIIVELWERTNGNFRFPDNFYSYIRKRPNHLGSSMRSLRQGKK